MICKNSMKPAVKGGEWCGLPKIARWKITRNSSTWLSSGLCGIKTSLSLVFSTPLFRCWSRVRSIYSIEFWQAFNPSTYDPKPRGVKRKAFAQHLSDLVQCQSLSVILSREFMDARSRRLQSVGSNVCHFDYLRFTILMASQLPLNWFKS